VGPGIPYCNYTLPSGQGISGLLQYPITVQVNDTSAGGSSYFANGMWAHISSFTIIRATPNDTSDTADGQSRYWYDLTNVNATECGFDVCVKKYNGSMNKAIFSERVLDTFTNTTYQLESGNVPSLIIQPPSSWTNRSDANDANTFSVDPNTMMGLSNMFAAGQERSFWKGAAYHAIGLHVTADSDIVSYLDNLDSTGTTAMMESIAASMTRRMREAPGSESVGLGSTEKGILYQDIPFVNVRWGWIAFPTALVFLALLFLIITIWENMRSDMMLWKSNSLANFYHPLTKEGRDTLQTGQSAAEAEEIAESMKVQWRKTNAGYRLVQPHEA
jgi:hypothetical protein